MADQKLSEKTVQSTVPSGTSKIYIVVDGQDRQMNADLIPISTEAQTLIDDNTANITTNTSNIATNTSNIAINASNITTNIANIATLRGITNTNLASQVIETPLIDWDADVHEPLRVWNAVNAGLGPILIANNTQLHYRTKRIVYTEISSQDNYDLIITTWREQKQYSTSGVVTVGTGGNLTLSASNSNLYLDNVETYRIVNGTITNGLVEDLGTVAGAISTAVDALPTTLNVGQDTILLIDDTGKQWIYIGEKEIIGNGIATTDAEYRELTSVSADPAPTVSPSVKVFNAAGDAKFSADTLLQDTNEVQFNKNGSGNIDMILTPQSFSGTVIPLTNRVGAYNNTSQTADTYTIDTNPLDGGNARWVISTVGKVAFPDVTGSTQVAGSDFEADASYDAFIMRYGTTNEHFFVKR